jgi:membrane protease YdiL (CAAX protease family)
VPELISGRVVTHWVDEPGGEDSTPAMTDEPRPSEPPGSPTSPWHAPPPPGSPSAPVAPGWDGRGNGAPPAPEQPVHEQPSHEQPAYVPVPAYVPAPPSIFDPAQHAPPAPGRYPQAPAPPPPAPPVPWGYEPPPPPAGPARYGTGPVPVTPPGPWQPSSPWSAPGYDPSWTVPTPPDQPGPPGTVLWPRTIAWMRLDPERPGRWGLPDIVLGIASFLVGAILMSGAVAALGGAASGEGPAGFARANEGVVNIAGLLGSWVATLAFLKLIVRMKGSGTLRTDLGFSFSWWDPLIGLGAAFVTLILSGIVQVTAGAVTGSEPASNSEAIFGDVVNNKPLLVVMALLASVGAPLVEELLFRGLALRAIEKRFGGVVGVIGSSLLFGAMHFQPGTVSPVVLIAGISVYGLVFSILTRWWQRVGPAVFTHIWVNTLATAVVLLPALLH